MDNFHRVHLIELKYLPATNTKGSRVQIKSLRFADKVTIPYDHARNTVTEMFIDWNKSLNNDLGIICEGFNEKDMSTIISVRAFEPIKNIKKGGVLA
ncbi:MAG: hypothetical protein WCJ60_04335 [bacterium]